MSQRTDIHKVLIIGSGPIIIGQACEFDYSGTQACKALRKLGYEIVLVNSNPATIMTDPETADVTYIEPLNVERLEQIIAKERPDAILPNLGGQSGLNLCSELNKAGILEKYDVKVIGVQVDAIERGEDRIEFKKAMNELGIEMARSEVAYSVEEALAIADRLGYPVVLRPAYTMGGAGGGLVYNVDELKTVCARGLQASMVGQVLVEESILGWEELELELPYSEEELEVCREGLRARAGMLEREHARMQAEDLPRLERRPAQETYEQAVNALLENDVLAGQEMRHQASLSPIALLRSWKVDLAVDCGRMRHSLRGEATAYGRGLSLAAARASYAMEIVERASSYVSVARTGEHTFEVTNRRRPLPLVHASCAKLRSQGKDFLPLSSLPLETPFEDYVPLYWLEARDPEGKTVLVPAQAVFLFCNLDEQSLFLAGGSTGLASGNTEAEARLAALTEIVERDAEATTPFSREGCFVLKSRDERLQALLDDYAARGIQIQFQDITTELGVPVYRCFVMSRRGEVAQATGANLCGSRAALAALTEVPWPYPYGEPTGPALGGLPVRWLEDLPDYSLPSAEASCKLLEKTLCAQGRTPLYVDISRKDLDMPVVRALVPGLELTADFDRFSRPSLRLLARYTARWQK